MSLCGYSNYAHIVQRRAQHELQCSESYGDEQADQQNVVQRDWPKGMADTIVCGIANEPETQVSGGSPCSTLSGIGCGVEYSTCTASAEPQRSNDSDVSEPFTMDSLGWFAKCRGCGCMTAHEQIINGADVPFCRRCQATLDNACPSMRAKMIDTLVYVHQAWSSAGF